MNLQQITEKILEQTQYQGNKEPNIKAISASDFGNDLLQIYYRYKYGVPDRKEFGQDTLGTLVHLGIQGLFKDDKSFLIEPKFECKFENDWSLTGSIDLLNLNDREIIDIKVTKQYTVEKVIKDLNHQYRWQLSVYKYLVEQEFDDIFSTKLLLVLKDGGYNFRKNAIEPSIELLEIEPIDGSKVEKKFFEIVDTIERYENLGELGWRHV